VSWRHRNLLGGAEQLNVSVGISQLGGNSTIGVGYNGAVSFTKPDWLQRHQSLQSNIGAVKQHFDAFDQTSASIGLLVNRRFSEHWGGSLGVAAEQETIVQQGVTSDYTLLSLPTTVKYDDTDDLLDPATGIRAAAQLTPTQPLAGRISAPFALTQIAASTYFDLADPGRSVFALRGLLGYAIGVGQFELPADKRYYAGGSATVRGYRFQSIGPRFPDNRPQGGTAVAAGTLEFRQRFLEDYGAVIFVDAGQVAANSAPFTADWRLGAGIGARYYTSLGPIRVDVALPLDRQPNSGSFELYLGLGQAF
jgi:translocation and assembly module TamA